MFFYREAPNVAPVIPDPYFPDSYFSNVSLLLRGNGTTGQTLTTLSIKDDSNNDFAITKYGDAKISNTVYKYGTSSLSFDGNGDYLRLVNTPMQFNSSDFTIESWVYLNSMPISDSWPSNWWQHMVVATVGTPGAGDGCGLMIGSTKIILQSNDGQIINGTHEIGRAHV